VEQKGTEGARAPGISLEEEEPCPAYAKVTFPAGEEGPPLSIKRKDGKLILLDQYQGEGFTTRQVIEVLKKFQVEDALIVTGEKNVFLERSARNIPKVQVLRYEGLNVYDILHHEHLILFSGAVQGIQGVLAS
jgi:large subunit ribosomal protein L4